MRAPRIALFVSTAALLAAAGAHAQAAPAQATPAPSAAAPAAGYTDAELTSFDAAMTRVRAVSDSLNGAQPTPEQQAEMAAAVQESGLEIERFNAISTAAASDPELGARLALLKTPEPAPGTPAAGVSEDELTKFVAAMTQIRTVQDGIQNGQPTPDQAAALTAAVEGSGLAVERFNAISQVVSQDAYLQAKAAVIDARQSKGVSQ